MANSRSDRLIVFAACAVAALSTIGAALPYPVLPPLFADGHATSLNSFMQLPGKLLFSLAVAIYPVGLLVGTTLLGPLSDRYGRRRILLSTTAIAVLGHLITAWALVLGNYPLFLAARLLTGLVEGNSAVARALLADALEGAARAQAFASFNGALYAGWLIGPLVAGLLVPFGVAAPFVGAAVMLALTGSVAAIAFTATGSVVREGSLWHTVAARNALSLLAHPPLRRLFLIHMGYTLGATAFYEFYPVWLVEFAGYGTRGIAIVTAALCTVMSGTSMLLGRGFGPPALPQYLRLYALGTALAILGPALLGPPVGLAFLVLFGVPNALYNSVLTVYVSDRFGHLGQGSVMSLISTTFSLSNIVTALIGGVITLVDTRLILILGAAATAWAAWCFGAEQRQGRAAAASGSS